MAMDNDFLICACADIVAFTMILTSLNPDAAVFADLFYMCMQEPLFAMIPTSWNVHSNFSNNEFGIPRCTFVFAMIFALFACIGKLNFEVA